MPSAKPTLRERLGGRWALSWEASLLGSVLISILIVVRGSALEGPDPRPETALRWFLVALIAVVIKSCWQIVADRTFLRRRRVEPLPVSGVILFDMSVGVVFGASTILAEIVVDPTGQAITPVAAVVRILAFALTTVCWYVITTILFDARQRFWDERERLLDELVQAQMAQVQEQQVIEGLRAQVRDELKAPLAEAQLATASALLDEQGESAEISEQLRGLATGSIRSLSHAMAKEGERTYPRSGFVVVMRSFASEIRFAIVPVLILIATAYLIDVTIRSGTQISVLATVVFAAVCAVIMAGANAAMDRLPRFRIPIYAGAFVLLEAIALLYVSGVAPGSGGSITLSGREVAALVLIVTIGLLGTSYAAAVMTHRVRVLARLRADADQATAEQMAMAQRISDASRIIASDLHGSLQTRLMVCAGALDQATATGDAELVRQALDQAWKVLRNPFSDGAGEQTLTEVVERHVKRWRGLVEVDTLVEPRLLMSGPSIVEAVDVVLEEGLANAYRHGHAGRARVVLSLDSGIPTICIEDDGVGPGASDPGLGSRRMAGFGGVELRPGGVGTLGDPGCVLHVRLDSVTTP